MMGPVTIINSRRECFASKFQGLVIKEIIWSRENFVAEIIFELTFKSENHFECVKLGSRELHYNKRNRLRNI
jgi:hypothetical protein